jgi:Flp pilus assembly protein TadG
MEAVMMSRLNAKLADSSGQSAVEIALVLPLLVLMALGIYDFSRAIQANNIIVNMSREGANLVSRTTRDPQDIMNALAFTANPLAINTDGMMYITKGKVSGGVVSYPNSPVPWEGNTNRTGLSSYIGTMASTLEGKDSQNRQLTADGDFYVFEVLYRHQFLFGTLFPGVPAPMILRSTTIL